MEIPGSCSTRAIAFMEAVDEVSSDNRFAGMIADDFCLVRSSTLDFLHLLKLLKRRK